MRAGRRAPRLCGIPAPAQPGRPRCTNVSSTWSPCSGHSTRSAGSQIPGRELAQSFTYHHYSLNTLNPADTAIDPKTPLLLGSLGISETDLLQLLALLKDQMPFDTAGNCTLDRRRLSLLYRHVRIARALNLRIEDFIQALQLLFGPSRLVLTTLDQIEQLTAFTAWLRTSPFSIAELRLHPGRRRNRASHLRQHERHRRPARPAGAGRPGPQPGRRPSRPPRGDLQRDRGTPGRHPRLHPSDLTSAAIQTALAATFTDGTPDTASRPGRPPRPRPPAGTGGGAVLQTEAGRRQRSATSAANPVRWASRTSRLSPAATSSPSASTVPSPSSRDNAAGLVQTGPRRLRIHRVPLGRQPGTAGRPVASGSEPPRLAVRRHGPARAPIDALSRLRDGLSTCLTLGINGYSLKKLGDDTSFAALAEARDVAIGAFSAKYPDETARAQTLQPYQDQINTIKRDALCDYILARRSDLKFRDHNEIYDFFLLDVDTGGCFRTSRVVSAISSVQLYVQRCLLNLEQTDPQLNPAVAAAHVDPTCIPADEWEWRKNYRVWEANRKVFLYPESYTRPRSPRYQDPAPGRSRR